MSKKGVEQSKNPEQCDFDHPSFWFVTEDRIKSLLGGSIFYGPDIKSLDLKGEENVLDFGCGGGIAARSLMKSLTNKGHVLCVDTSSYWINVAKTRLRKFPNAECKVGDIRTLKVPEHSLDAIIAIHVLHHVAQQNLPSVSITLARLLRQGGRLLVREKTQASHGISPSEIRAVLSQAGLKETSQSLSGSEYRGLFVPDPDKSG